MNQETIDDQFTKTRLRRRNTIFNRTTRLGSNDEISEESEDSNNEYAGKTDSTNNNTSYFENGLISSTDVTTEIVAYCYRTARSDPTIPKNYQQMLRSQEKKNDYKQSISKCKT
jgi:hypothetical protein